ncbi:MAG: hypothetical protein K2N34_07965 [Lachnospiraceae bacterium]|nr:hypothetical protein [Lachnospiraceae bacterium]
MRRILSVLLIVLLGLSFTACCGGASIVIDEDTRYGTTEYIANMIAEEVGGDLHRIETVNPYTTDFDELRHVISIGRVTSDRSVFDNLDSREDITF